MKLLYLNLFCAAPKASMANPVDLNSALRRIDWALNYTAAALNQPDSKSGRELRDSGFCSVILRDQAGEATHVENFDEGFCAVISPSGENVIVTDKQPEANAANCMMWLERVKQYCCWCLEVEEAEKANSRPPVLESQFNIPELRLWIGKAAHQYFENWKQQSMRRAAERLKNDPEFDRELKANVRESLSVTRVASAVRG